MCWIGRIAVYFSAAVRTTHFLFLVRYNRIGMFHFFGWNFLEYIYNWRHEGKNSIVDNHKANKWRARAPGTPFIYTVLCIPSSFIYLFIRDTAYYCINYDKNNITSVLSALHVIYHWFISATSIEYTTTHIEAPLVLADLPIFHIKPKYYILLCVLRIWPDPNNSCNVEYAQLNVMVENQSRFPLPINIRTSYVLL